MNYFTKILLVIFNSVFLIRGHNFTKKMASYKIEPLKHSVADLGEGPHWDVGTQSLYFVDINTAKLYRYDYNEDKTYETKIENEHHASFIIPIEGKPNHFAVGTDRRVCDIEWDGKSSVSKINSILFQVEADNKIYFENRFNDAKADPMGRFYGGTMPISVNEDMFKTKRTGNFYRYEENTKLPILLRDKIAISNGLTWNTKAKKFYYIDSVDLSVTEYDYDIATGDIKNPKVLIDFNLKDGKEKQYIPDGMTIDSDGFLYVATFGGSKILKINPNNGKIEMEIKMPCEQITSVAFGGPNLDILYVTTAAMFGKAAPGGQTFKITDLGAKGLEMNKLKF